MANEYEQRCAAEFQRDMRDKEKGTAKEKAQCLAVWHTACHTDPALVCERASWLLNGSYGKGAHDAAWSLVDANEAVDELLAIVAVLEWSVPPSLLDIGYGSTHTLRAMVSAMVIEAIAEREATR